MSDESWVEKHRPQSFDELQGNNSAVKDLKQWADSWKPGDDPQLLVGPPGTGKTTTAYLLADFLDVPLSQINASSARKTEDIADLTASARSTPADGGLQLILIDEIDGWQKGKAGPDKQPMYDVLDDPPNPIILTANDLYQVPDGVKSRVNDRKFKLGKRSRAAKIRDIAAKEGVDLDERDEEKLASRPDLRSAINDLQMMAGSDVPIGDDERDWDEGEFDAIPEIMTGNKYAGDNISPDQLVIWLDQGIAKQYRGLEAGVAYDTLARADKWLGRAQSTRNYRYWKYAAALARMTSEQRLSESHSTYVPDLFPEWYRHSIAKATSDKPISRVYRKLKDYDGRYTFAGSFIYFKNVILQILQNLDTEERKQIALEAGLREDEVEILNLKKEEYEQWAGGKDSSVEEYESKGQSVFDF